MNPNLLVLPLSSKRDVVLARMRARQIGGLLGLDSRDQAFLAAGVFALAYETWKNRSQPALVFRLDRDVLRVLPTGEDKKKNIPLNPLLRIEKVLPGSPSWSVSDLQWMIQTLKEHTETGIFEEIIKLNQDLVQVQTTASDHSPKRVGRETAA